MIAFCTVRKHQGADWGVCDTERNLWYPAGSLWGKGAPESLLAYIRMEERPAVPVLDGIEGIPLDRKALEAPIPNPVRNIFCVGKNYLDHVKELAAHAGGGTGYPQFFTKATASVNGPFDTIPTHAGVTEQMDYEAELAVIIGKPGRDIAAAEAYGHIFGYTALNDVTARDLQKRHGQWFKGKSLDGFCPMGPWIVPRDAVSWPLELTVKGFVNGEMRQCASTRDMMVPVDRLIESLSAGMTLLAGDIIATGTPAGVGMGMDPPRFLKSGDAVRVEIDGIGWIENRVE
jgi:2-keto-4-pentenoate hydratase/2-oxohepta-3-ene-1,7-dioic acid hydratase in catechol pathway